MAETLVPNGGYVVPEHACDEDGVQVRSFLVGDRKEFEVPDSVPMAIPVGMHQGDTLADTIQRLITNRLLAERLAAEGFDTPEDADDFDVNDDEFPQSPFEYTFDPLTGRYRDATGMLVNQDHIEEYDNGPANEARTSGSSAVGSGGSGEVVQSQSGSK